MERLDLRAEKAGDKNTRFWITKSAEKIMLDKRRLIVKE